MLKKARNTAITGKEKMVKNKTIVKKTFFVMVGNETFSVLAENYKDAVKKINNKIKNK